MPPHTSTLVTAFIENLSDWVDPGAIRTLLESVRDGYNAAPVWARGGLLVMLGFAVVAVILRFTRSMPGRLAAVAVTAALIGFAFREPGR